MSHHLNKLLGIPTSSRKRKRVVNESKEKINTGYRTGIDPPPPKPKHARRKYCVVNDDIDGPSDTIRQVLLDWHPEAFNEIGVRRNVYSFLGLMDAVRFCLRSVLVARMALRLSENRRIFEETIQYLISFDSEFVPPDKRLCEQMNATTTDLSGKKITFKFHRHQEFADAYFADVIRKIVQFGSILCIGWVLEVRNDHQIGLSEHVISALNESVLYTIKRKEFAKFQWLLELKEIRFDRTWLEVAIEYDLQQFIEHLLFKYNVRRSISYANWARSIAMMELLWRYKFPFTAKITNKFIAQRDLEKVTWLLGKGVQEDRDIKEDKEPSYLEQAIKMDNYAAMEKLAEFGFQCSTALLAKTLLQGKLTAVEYLYKFYFRDSQGRPKRMAFEDVEEHGDFLFQFTCKLAPENQSDIMNPNLLATLRYMDEEHCNDLSFTLLFSTLIRNQYVGPLHEFFKLYPSSLSVNHMDEAILLESNEVVDWLLENKVACSQLGMKQLIESDKAWKWLRIQKLLNHPVCAHLQLQPLWPTIQKELRPSTEFHLVPMRICPPQESEELDVVEMNVCL